MKMRLVSLILVALLMMAGASALAERTITVQGVGTVKVDADRVEINLGVRDVAEDVVAVQSSINAKMDTVIEAIRGMGDCVVSVSTNGIGIYPNYNYDDGERIVGYTAYNGIVVTLSDVDAAGACIDAAFAAGANSLDYVSFSAADTAQAADKALALAVESAKAKAQVLAEAAGVGLGGILEIREGYDMGYDSNAAYAKVTEEDAGMGTQVLPSRQSVSANAVVTFAIEDSDAD